MPEILQLQNSDPAFLVLFVILSIWSLVWKGFSLWISGGKRDKVWFIILLVFNTLGILDILYIFIFSKMKRRASKARITRRKKAE